MEILLIALDNLMIIKWYLGYTPIFILVIRNVALIYWDHDSL